MNFGILQEALWQLKSEKQLLGKIKPGTQDDLRDLLAYGYYFEKKKSIQKVADHFQIKENVLKQKINHLKEKGLLPVEPGIPELSKEQLKYVLQHHIEEPQKIAAALEIEPKKVVMAISYLRYHGKTNYRQLQTIFNKKTEEYILTNYRKAPEEIARILGIEVRLVNAQIESLWERGLLERVVAYVGKRKNHIYLPKSTENYYRVK